VLGWARSFVPSRPVHASGGFFVRRPLRPRPSLAVVLVPFLAVAASASLSPPPAAAHPQPRDVLDAAGIRQALDRLPVTGSALFVAAHPDDENTAFLAWLANGRKVRTAYLSVTRGDGGQNLIGPDTGSLLGVIRTQELLAARRIDGADQFFTRAIDFGYSKGPEETLETWGRDRTLGDVVFVIRKFRPDVIVTRFPPDGGGGHGHHTASSILAEEAFVAAADPTRFPEQLAHVRPWQAKRLAWNAFRFGAQGPDTTAGRLAVDIGAYDALLGRSYTEIAGESRSMHKSQGFGSAERRGSFTNSLAPRLGEPAKTDLFDGIDLTWGRVPGAAKLPALFARAAKEFRADAPHTIVPTLLEARAVLSAIPGGADDPLVVQRRADLDALIRSCLGLWVEAIAATPTVTAGSRLRVATAAIVRSPVPVTLRGVAFDLPAPANETPRALAFNVASVDTFQVPIPAGVPPTTPYWLARAPLAGSFEVADEALVGTPENAPVVSARFTFDVAGKPFELSAPVVHRWTDPVQGERWRDLVVVPPATLRFEQGVTLFPDAGPRPVRVVVTAAEAAARGAVRLDLPDGWSAAPAAAQVAFAEAMTDTTLTFVVTPAAAPASARITASFVPAGAGGRAYALRAQELDYPHIPLQALLLPAEAHVVRADVRKTGARIAYLMGSGDVVPDALRQMGFGVTLLGDDDVAQSDLSGYDAIVVGVRAYNTRPRLLRQQKRLLDYVAGGGRLVVQYNTAENALQDRLGPFPFRISRDRVTVEGAEMRLLAPAHPLLTAPNRIGADDFAGWVQERGLYYANPFDPRYETPLSSNDPGEPARDGGLLFARHGKGTFVYAAHAFFRQLPAGVPGAYRLFANLVSNGPAPGARL
jgi:LmbE family N-acetylglucosaminyl deacetylase